MQVYLPQELYDEVKGRCLPASELLQAAVRAEVHRQALLEEGDRYLDELEAEVGEPTGDEIAQAAALVERLTRRSRAETG